MKNEVPSEKTWLAFAEGLRPLGLGIFAKSDVKITEDGKGDLRILSLMLLARTLSNLKAALILLREKQIVEARAVARLCYENQYWVLALLKDGTKFRDDMVKDEMKRKRMHSQELFKTGELNDEMETNLRAWMREHSEYHVAETLNPKGVAYRAKNESYLFYQHLSWDAHPSIETLNRYFMEPDKHGSPGIDVEPPLQADEVIATLNLLCLPVLGVLLGVGELLAYATPPVEIQNAASEYKRLTELTGTF